MTSEPPVISVRGLGKRYRIWTHSRPTTISDRIDAVLHFARSAREERAVPLREDIWALRDVSFDVGRGEILGVIGPNGAGKSTLLSILARITEPTEGRAEIRGRVSSILEVGTGFHPELSGRDNVFLNGAILGMTREETEARLDDIVDFAEVREFIDMPIKRYSSGMYVRLAFAVAAQLDPEVLLLDEVLAVGDQGFQEKSLKRITEMTAAGRTVVFVSHDVNSVRRLCTTALVVDGGTVAFRGDVPEAIDRYLETVHGGTAPAALHHGRAGEARVQAVRVESGGARRMVAAGAPLEIHVDIAADEALDGAGLELEIDILAASGDRYVSLSTDVPSKPLAAGLAAVSTVTCVLAELPLRSGPYQISATLSRRGEPIDRIVEPDALRITPSDRYGVGSAEEGSASPVLTQHTWQVVEAVETTVEPEVVPQETRA